MSKDFRPIFDVQKADIRKLIPSTDQKDSEKKESKEESVEGLRKAINSLQEEVSALRAEREMLKRTLQDKEEELSRLKEKMDLLGRKDHLLSEVYTKILEGLEEARESVKKDFLEIGKRVIKEFLMTDLVPKEEIVTRILNQVFEKSLDLRGTVKILLSPSDVERVYDLIGDLRERLSEKVDIEIEADQSLREGEVRIETPKFMIERKHDEIIEEIFREVIKDVLEGG